MARKVIAIDGPAGAGKSTLARALAARLGVAYLNTGAMYRAVTAAALGRRIGLHDAQALAGLARSLRFSLDRGEPPSLAIDGLPEGADLASSQVEAVVSEVAAHRPVREVLRAEQRRLGERGAVVEGRDIGTVVFPDAAVKIFLLASPEERAARRQAERREDGPALRAALGRRDARDAETNPLVPAPDAHAVDTTGRPVGDVLEEIEALAREAERGARG
ncbi:MAG TPA: (d)CMP kinase [Actinomycetota bacterium]|nr:(d)CMP kinase [Actinomycetota bacterium]